jgi:nucleotide-binding universal stress UspA family protein
MERPMRRSRRRARIEKICCAVDLEERSRVAMERAAELATRFEADLALVYVIAPPPEAAGDVLVSSPGPASVDAEMAEATLARWRANAERRVGRSVAVRVLRGEPAAEIVRLAREERCDLLVLGTHGPTGMPGSVGERVKRGSPCPVLVAHDHEAIEGRDVAESSVSVRSPPGGPAVPGA